MTQDPDDVNELHRNVNLLTEKDPFENIAPARIKNQLKLTLLDMLDYLEANIPDDEDRPWNLTHRNHLEYLEERLWFLFQHQHAVWRYYNKNPRGRL